MNKRKFNSITILLILIALTSCKLTEDEEEALYTAQADLEQLADQIIITFPANNIVITDSIVTVRADIPTSAGVQNVSLFVDGEEVAEDTDGAPWEITWPAYYWADGGVHTLLLKAVTAGGNEVRNNQLIEVTVDTQANSALRFSNNIDGLTIKDTNTLSVEFESFHNAIGYDISYTSGGNFGTAFTNSTEVVLSNLDVGLFELRYRAISGTLIGPWSNPAYIEVLPPDLPVINQPVITKTNSGYDVILSWEDLGNGNNYSIYVTDVLDNSQSVDSTTNNSLTLSGLEIGEYKWQLKRTNPLGQDSLMSLIDTLELGAFTRTFGGLKGEYPYKMIATNDNGYVILANSESHEITGGNDDQRFDWVFKLDSTGDMVWQYLNDSAGILKSYRDVVELSDNSIVIVGYDKSTQKASAIKFDANGNLAWEIKYSPDPVNFGHSYSHIVEFDNKLYILGRQAPTGTCTPICTQYYLQTITTTDGLLSNRTDIPAISGITIYSIAEVLLASNGNLMIAGLALPENGDTNIGYNPLMGGFVQQLDSSLSQVSAWHHVGAGKNYVLRGINGAIELSNGRYAVIGGIIPDGFIITVDNNDGSNFGVYTHWKKTGSNFLPIIPGQNGDIHGFFRDDNSESELELVTINSILNINSTNPVNGFTNGASVDFVDNQDGTYTFLINYNNNIVVTKRRGY